MNLFWRPSPARLRVRRIGGGGCATTQGSGMDNSCLQGISTCGDRKCLFGDDLRDREQLYHLLEVWAGSHGNGRVPSVVRPPRRVLEPRTKQSRAFAESAAWMYRFHALQLSRRKNGSSKNKETQMQKPGGRGQAATLPQQNLRMHQLELCAHEEQARRYSNEEAGVNFG